MAVFQKGFNYVQDGRGNRLVYHLRGCNLCCPWCSNPEGMEFSAAPGTPVSEIVDEALSCRPMFFDGGGVTFTGGECTCQFDALKEALTLLKQAGISTAIETNGTAARLPELFGLTDELIVDCKHYDPGIHLHTLGASNETVLANIAAAAAEHPDLLIRIPLIGGFNASEEDMERFAELFLRLGADRARIELLPYHEYGKDKWAKCGKKYTVHDAFISPEQREKNEDILRRHGLTVVRT
ncbi:MAG: radical SAM protein [Saccharofermentans sp.]|nr:radical SAM protein [Saccharofermentans sp.]